MALDDAELHRVISHWRLLPVAIRRGILAIIDSQANVDHE